jgi:AcrR family transcriptional regulator
MQKRERLSRDQRREQILRVALDTVARQGVRGATLTNIAAGVGITYPALYAHFPSRKDLLLALLDHLFDHIQETYSGAFQENAVDHLRAIGRANARLIRAGEDGCVLPFFEFVAADPEENLREAFGERELALVDRLADIVRRGRRQGTIIQEADPEQIAWMVMGCGWTDDTAALMGLDDDWTLERSEEMLEWILRSVAVARGADSPAAGSAGAPPDSDSPVAASSAAGSRGG